MEVQAVSIADIGEVISVSILAFQDPLFYGFTLMIALAVALGIRRIMVGVKQT